MITTVAVCPHPPLLFRELSGRHDVAAGLRGACLEVVRSVVAGAPDVVAVIGGAEASADWDPALPADVRRFGTTDPAERPGLPLSLGVAKRLLQEVGWQGTVEMHAIGWSAQPAEVDALAARLAHRPERVGLVVLGEGSTRRGDKAPGYLDERAFGFDEETGRALASGDVEALLAADAELADQLMVSGRAPFQVLASVVRREGGQPAAELVHADDPHGVMYFVARWKLS